MINFRTDKIPARKRGSGNTVLCLTKKLFATESIWQRENQFPLLIDTQCLNHTPGVASCSCSQHTTDSMSFVCWFVCLFRERKNLKLGGRIWMDIGERKEYNLNICMKLSKMNKIIKKSRLFLVLRDIIHVYQ